MSAEKFVLIQRHLLLVFLTTLMDMDHISMISIMNTVEGFLGQHGIALVALGHVAMTQVTQFHIPFTDIIMPAA